MNPTKLIFPASKALGVALLLLCWSFATAETIFVVNSQSRLLSRIDTTTDTVDNSFASLGNVPNKVVVDTDYLWVVNSGDNAIQKLDRDSGATLSNIFVGPGSNPWDAVLHQQYLYVSGLFTGKVYKLDTISGSVVGSVAVGTAPEALQVIGNTLYVSNAGNYTENYAGSSISVIDIPSFSVTATIPVAVNPQYLAAHHGKLHVSCTGNWTDLGGAICIIDPQSNSVEHTIPLGGTPGRLWIASDDLAYVGDSNGLYLYSYNPSSFELLHGINNPLPNGGSEITGNQSFIAILSPTWGENGIVRLLHQDLSPWKTYTVAMMPTDLKLGSSPADNDDLILPAGTLQVYPNPLHRDSQLHFSSKELLHGKLDIYNLKGQIVASSSYAGRSLSLPDWHLPSGVYFYRMRSSAADGKDYRGKFMVLK